MDRVTTSEFESQAARTLPEAVFDFVAAGAGTGRSIADNARAWAAWRILPRILAGAGSVSTSVTVQGQDVFAPILLAPAGRQRALHPDGELAVARAAARAGTIYTLATSATTDLHDVATAGAPMWQQLYVSTDRDWTSLIIHETARLGFTQLVVTVDRPMEAHRPGSARHGGMGPLPAGVAVTSHRGDGSTRGAEPGVWDASLTWSTIRAIIDESPIPVALKGVLHPDDARRAIDLGVSAIIVSNHGGRQIDGVLPTAEALVPIVDATRRSIPVYVDGGIRSGGDVFRAVALGADAVLIGRPYLWALAAGGQEGVERVLASLGDELAEVMALSGCRTVADITSDHVR